MIHAMMLAGGKRKNRMLTACLAEKNGRDRHLIMHFRIMMQYVERMLDVCINIFVASPYDKCKSSNCVNQICSMQ